MCCCCVSSTKDKLLFNCLFIHWSVVIRFCFRFSLFFLCPFLKGIWFGENICIFVYTIFAIYKHRYFVREKKINQILYLYLKAKIVVCEWFMDIWMVKHISSQANLSLIHAYERCANASWTWKKIQKKRKITDESQPTPVCYLPFITAVMWTPRRTIIRLR